MPYGVRKAGDHRWQTVNTETGKVFGTHPTEEQAEAQKRALYVNAPPEQEKAKS